MVEIKSPTFKISNSLLESIQSLYSKEFSCSLDKDKSLAEAISKTHQYYIENPEAQSPWQEKWFQKAYLAYYLPLNHLRAKGVLHRIKNLKAFKDIEWVFEWGSGNGAFSLAAIEYNDSLKFQFVERSKQAIAQHKALQRDIEASFKNKVTDFHKNKESGGDLLSFCYSLTESNSLPNFIYDFDQLLILEPSTNQDGRRLMAYREELLEEGYEVLAPCTHQQSCPLLKESKKDWCHDTFFVEYPDYLKNIESKIPMKLSNLSVSYLFVSRNYKNSNQGKLRVTGNTLKERGKVRQMVCRKDEREFLTWFPKRQEVPFIARGELVELDGDYTKKSNEIRGNVLALK